MTTRPQSGEPGRGFPPAGDCRRRAAPGPRGRPILLISLTTFAGLFPLLQETNVQAGFLIKMAVSLGQGVLSATFISPGLIPAGHRVLEDLRGLVGWRKE